MDRASQVLVQGVPPGVPNSYRALADHGGVPCSTLHHRARGRRPIEVKAESQQYLTPSEEKAVSDFIIQMSALGLPVRMKFIPFIAYSATRHRPMADRPLKPPGKNWAKALENRHPELKARRVRALDWNRHEINIYEKVTHWFEVIGKLLHDHSILAENVYNMDETGVMLSKLGSAKVLVGKDEMRDYRGARVKRITVTAIECISGDGRYLKPMIIWPAATHRSNWTTHPTPGWHYACSESGYTDSKISSEWLKRVFDPQTKERADGKARVLICDGFGTHESLEILEHCLANNIILCRLPSHTSHKLQPFDTAVFAPLKSAYRDNVELMERGGVNTIGKQHFTILYGPARETAFTRRNILAGWSSAGLFPFNPDRVLRNMPKPPAELTKVDIVEVIHSQQDGPLRTQATPVSAEAFVSLQNLILRQDAHTLGEKSRESLQRHLQKLAKAAQTSFAKSALQHDQIRFLLKSNDEAKVGRSTRSVVLGRAKVMSYEDLVEARAKRNEKEATKEAKNSGSRGRKRKGAAPEADIPQPNTKSARVGASQEYTHGCVAPAAQMW